MLLHKIIESEALSTALITLFIALLGLVTVKVKGMAQKLHDSMEIMKTSLKDQGKDIKKAKEQVTNHHGTNLRDDLDNFRADFKLQMNDMRSLIAAQESLAIERETRSEAWRNSIDDRLLLLDQKVENLKTGSSRTHDRMWEAINQAEKHGRL